MPELGTPLAQETQIPDVTQYQIVGGSQYSAPTPQGTMAQSRHGLVTRFNAHLMPVAIAAASFFSPQALVSESVYFRRNSTTSSITLSNMWATDLWVYSPELVTAEQVSWLDALFALPAPGELPSYPTSDE